MKWQRLREVQLHGNADGLDAGIEFVVDGDTPERALRRARAMAVEALALPADCELPGESAHRAELVLA